MIRQDAPVKRNPGGCCKSGGMPGRGRLRVQCHKIQSGSDIVRCFPRRDKTVTGIPLYEVVKQFSIIQLLSSKNS